MTWKKHEDADANRYYVYQYLREDGTPYYIGKGCGQRITNPHAVDIPVDPNRRQFIQTNMSEVDALSLEEQLTRYYGLLNDGTGILENKIHGGGHVSPRGFLGHTHTQESRKQISISNTGKLRTEEQKQNYRKPKSKEHAEKIRQANLGRPDDGRYVKISATKKGKPWSQARWDAQMLKKKKDDVA